MTTTPATSALGPDFPVPVEQRYFEDYVPGAAYRYGSIAVTEADILRFAGEFDPQSIHTDPVAAAAGPFDGLIASGWHTLATALGSPPLIFDTMREPMFPSDETIRPGSDEKYETADEPRARAAPRADEPAARNMAAPCPGRAARADPIRSGNDAKNETALPTNAEIAE
ncbi:MaoC/PaaZ C-terminal domain-containing protein [Streptomyces sp. NPDC088785]|uniref:MaoC/PaaZ C-terminal domain-containing protein n=1 Tax=Streptomyces sp. NPDC088785 TaxID=3365897 RepID=UPI00381A7B90